MVCLSAADSEVFYESGAGPAGKEFYHLLQYMSEYWRYINQ